jgi:D-beta-D-heptose 7-phosphate kinase/D-beta-D-heptose 1-phosphate adenosyltransferase
MASIAHTLAGMQGRRVLVVGDIMLDEYVYGSVDRKSPESGAPVLLQQDRRCMPGGAANVAVNVASLDGHCHLIGLCGDDTSAASLFEKLSEWSNITLDVVRSTRWQTTTKTRFVNQESNAHILRFDRELSGEPTSEMFMDLKN